MEMPKNLFENIFRIRNEKTFHQLAMDIFEIQSRYNPIYRKYFQNLNFELEKVNTIEDIPFLPIDFFKSHDVILENTEPEIIFSSSGTSGASQSRHLVADLKLYEKSFMTAFRHFFGDISDQCVLALLPSYLEREGSSLIYMVDKLIDSSVCKQSGFFLNNTDELTQKIHSPEFKNRKILLLGVTFALLDLAEQFEINHSNLIVMETGGMKGRRKEIIREELHSFLCQRFGVKKIYSEYGMTELLSQAYSKGDGIFECPPWMRILIRDANDPFSILPDGQSGGINIIDLANIHSCSFIMTQDLGRKHPDGSFEILGRFDSSDVRGCNLLVQ